tara:strand:+ start:42 stop:803 length:762 start_codon:yes stop_codon:yes gene_type:complete
MNISKIKKVLLSSAIVLVSLSSFINLVRERNFITKNIKELISLDKIYDSDYEENQNKIWAKKILSGGYILFFRHAERDKWIDVQMYDALESELKDKKANNFRFAENEYFESAVCLNNRGKIQAKAMGEIIKYSKLPVGYIISSPSCRARQTADLVFGGYDKLDKVFLHKGPFSEVGNRSAYLKKYILNLPRSSDKNVIISAHNGVIGTHLFKGDKSLEEGGFYVLSVDNNKLVFEHEFHNFNSFSKHFFIRNH